MIQKNLSVNKPIEDYSCLSVNKLFFFLDHKTIESGEMGEMVKIIVYNNFIRYLHCP